ncbi:molybdopterin molybdotransferase MoeA [Methanothermococcus sp.]|uniref:molybdopterin molybdotransferase MoeA n=1 Tax=Methanothermococcus sp. TaxID=2614238 RepID=UPI0025FFD7DB|nr:molybdopterin molybdotransferase MoeA [Methanothermococcus sp.]
MIGVCDAKNILNKYSFNKTNYIDIYDSYGKVLAKDIISTTDIPFFNKSDKDGYAVVDLNLKYYTLIDEVLAGDMRNLKIKNDECVHVATGAKVPDGANYVIPIEYVEKLGNEIRLVEDIEETNIIKIGDDIKKNNEVLRKGDIINERNIGIIASLGIEKIKVYETPKVGIISTGNELHSIKDVNSKTIFSIVKKSNCQPIFIGSAKDDIDDLKSKINKALEHCDVIITSGGVSAGKKDYLPRVVSDMGKIIFHKVKMRPGMPMLFGEINEKPIFCMPGNVTSCLTCSYVFLLPFLKKLAHVPFSKEVVKAHLSEDIPSEYGMTYYRPVKLKNGVAYPTFKGSNLITSIAYADGLIEIKEDETLKNKDDIVDVWVFD